MRTITALITILLALAHATGAASDPADRPIAVVATTAMVGDLVRSVAGDRADVTVLIGEGVDPHLFKATRSDIAAMSKADVVFYNGLLLEGKMTDALIRTATRTPVYPVTELLAEGMLIEPAGIDHADPHVWMDPIRWASAAEVVRAKLSELDPEHADTYATNAAAYATELRELDGYARRVLATVPENARVLVTAHDAFHYFADAYGFRVEGIQGISTDSEAGVRDIERLVGLLVDDRIPAVFVESTVPDRNVRALVLGAKARGHTVAIGGELFSDAMGAPGTYEGTYLGMIDHNVTTIARALGGDAPARGWRGRLAASETRESR